MIDPAIKPPAPLTLEQALAKFCDVVDASGGLEIDYKGYVVPAADEEWIDLADAYMCACETLSRKIKWKKEIHFQFEYDLEYDGGNYDQAGRMAYVPARLIQMLGMEEAFQKHTGVDPVHIINWNTDVAYDEDGNEIEEP
jgi:hypothetical protein